MANIRNILERAKLKAQTPERERFRGAVLDYLKPMFPRAEVKDTSPLDSRSKAALLAGGAEIRLQLRRDADHALLLTRKQLFSKTEQQTAEAFVKSFAEILDFYDKPYWRYLADLQLNAVIARAVTGRATAVVQLIIETFSNWAQETYEGQRISAAIGIFGDPDDHLGLPLADYLRLNLAKVVSDGLTSMVAVSPDGVIAGHERLNGYETEKQTYAPLPYIPMAQWADGGNLAIALNRNGEILVFRLGRLEFAKRRGVWRAFGHHAIVRQMALSSRKHWPLELRKEVYLTALDVSFARCGGAIGLVKAGENINYPTGPLMPADQIGSPQASEKTKAITTLIENSSFEGANRKLRQELAGIDGAIIVSPDGTILTAGAILSVNVMSDEGARKTAAKTLGKHGLGIKISNDGKVEAFAGDPLISADPVFSIG